MLACTWKPGCIEILGTSGVRAYLQAMAASAKIAHFQFVFAPLLYIWIQRVMSPGKFRGIFYMFGLPGTTFWTSGSPEACSKCFRFDPKTKPRWLTANITYKDNKCLKPCLKFFPWQGTSSVIWMFLLSKPSSIFPKSFMTAAAGSVECNIHKAIAQFAMDLIANLIVLTCTVRPPLISG